MVVTLRFEIDDAQIEIAADIGLDTKGRLIARSCRNCANRIWAKNNIEALKDSGMAMQLILKNQLNPSNEESEKNPLVGNESDDSEKINQVHDTGIDWVALLKSACASTDTEKPTLENLAHWYPPILKNPLIDTDVVSKPTKEDSEAYRNSALRNILNTIYGRYYNCEELVKRIQNSLKDTEGNIAKAYNESLCEIKNELKYIHDSVNGIEDYIIHNYNDAEEYEDEDDDLEEYLNSMNDESEDEDEDDEEDNDMSYAEFFSFEEMMGNSTPSAEDYAKYAKENSKRKNKHKKKKSDKSTEDESEKPIDLPCIHKDSFKCSNGIFYTHNFYNNQTMMSVDRIHWVSCSEKNIPQEYKDIINQKYMIDIRTFVSGFSYWIAMVDPINTDTKLPVHIATTNKLLSKIFEMTYELSSNTIGHLYISMNKHDLINYIHSIIFDNPETNAYFKVLNTSYNDARRIRNGDDALPPDMAFCSRYGGPHWKDDFVDLDALNRNVVDFVIKYSTYTAE